MCVQASMCMYERDRERYWLTPLPSVHTSLPAPARVCVCVCAHVRVYERERDTGSCHSPSVHTSLPAQPNPAPLSEHHTSAPISQSTVILSPLISKPPPHGTSFPTETLKASYQLYVCGIFPKRLEGSWRQGPGAFLWTHVIQVILQQEHRLGSRGPCWGGGLRRRALSSGCQME